MSCNDIASSPGSDILGIPGLELLALRGEKRLDKYYNRDEPLGHVELGCVLLADDRGPPSCCAGVKMRKHGFQTPPPKFIDQNRDRTRTSLVVRRQRYKCDACGQTKMHPIPGMDPDHRMTQRLAEEIFHKGILYPFSEVARRFYVDERVCREIFHETADSLLATADAPSPFYIGIDPTRLGEVDVWSIVDLQTGRLIDLFEATTTSFPADYLQNLSYHDQVLLVCHDGATNIRTAVGKAFPKADLVLDRFHLIAQSQRLLRKFLDSLTDDKQLRMDPQWSDPESRHKLRGLYQCLLIRTGEPIRVSRWT